MDKDWKLEVKTAVKKGFIFAVIAEIATIAGGYYLYRKYKTDEEFRNKIQTEYPQLDESFKSVASFYLDSLPESWRNRITEPESAKDIPK